MADAPTANQIKTQLITLLTPVIGTALTKKAKLLDYLPLAFLVSEGEDISVLRSPLDTVTLVGGDITQRVNCLMISEQGFSQAPSQRDATRAIGEPRGRNLVTRTFLFAYVYQFGAGSEAVFSTNVEAMRTTINDNPKLGFATVTAGLAGQGAYIQSHGGLQMPSMLPAPFSGTICHTAEGLLVVNVIDPLGNV